MIPRTVVCHVHFYDVFRRLVPYIQTINPNTLIITCTSTEPLEIPSKLFPNAKIKQIRIANQGRDTLPLLILARQGYFESDAAVWRLHTKKSLHLLNGRKWLDELVELIAKDTQRVEYIQKLISDGIVDMVGAEKYTHFSSMRHHEDHRAIFARWCDDLKIQYQVGKPFVAGTIFVAHSKVLNMLADLNWKDEEFPLETTPEFSFLYKMLLLTSSVTPLLKHSSIFFELNKRTRPSPGITYSLEAFISNLSESFFPIR